MSIGERIRYERERLGMSQPQFAKIAGTTKQTLFSWESGKTFPNATQIAALARAGVDIDYLVTGRGLAERLMQISDVTQKAQVPELSRHQQESLQTILFALESRNPELLKEQLGERLANNEKQLLENFRQCDDDAKAALLSTSAVFAKKSD